MAKTTVHGGPSDTLAEPGQPGYQGDAGAGEGGNPPAAAPPAATEPQAAQAGTDVPGGTVAEVLAWVGDDLDRANRALDYELAKDTPRSSLLDKLVALGAGPDG